MTISEKLKKIVRRTFRILITTILVILGILLLILVLIQTKPVQNYGRGKIEAYLQNKLHTQVRIGNLYIGFPSRVILKNIYLEDRRKDTLLSGGNIEVEIGMLQLLRKEIRVSHLELDDITMKVNRRLPDSVYNFQFIIDAFSSDTVAEAPKKDSSAGFRFNIGTIHLHQIRAVYADDATGNDLDVRLGDFSTNLKTFDPTNQAYSIPVIQLNDVSGKIRQYQPILLLKKAADTIQAHNEKSQPVKLTLGYIDFNRIALDYQNDAQKMQSALRLGKFHLVSDSLDLKDFRFRLKEVSLTNTQAIIQFAEVLSQKSKDFQSQKSKDFQSKNSKGKSQKEGENKKSKFKSKKDELTEDSASQRVYWSVDIEKFNIDSTRFRYDDDNKKPLKTGMDYSHLDIQKLQINVVNFHADPKTYLADIRQISMEEKSGLVLKKLTTRASYSDTGVVLNKLLILTNRSEILTQSSVSYRSLDELSRNPGNLKTNLEFTNSRIAVKDILIFVPSLEEPLKDNQQAVIRLNGKVSGQLKDLRIPYLEIDGIGQTAISASGTIKGLPEASKAHYDIVLSRFKTTRTDIFRFIPPKSIPDNLRLPETINANGKFTGTAKRFLVQMHLLTSSGNATVNGTLDVDHKIYDLRASTQSVNLGYILKQDSVLGKFTLEATAKGSGFDPKQMNSVIHLKLDKGEYQNYIYHGLLVDADVHQGQVKLVSSMPDSNLSFKLNADANISEKWPSVKMNLELDTANLLALHLMKDTLQMHMLLNADFSSTNPDALNGNMKISDIGWTIGQQAMHTDSVILLAQHTDTAQLIHLNSEAADINWSGKYKLTQVSESLKQFINHYYKIESVKTDTTDAENWQLTLVLRPSPLVLALMPSLKGTDSLTGKMQFNSTQKDLNLLLHANKIQYGDQVIHQFNAVADTRENALGYRISVADAGKPGMQLYQTNIYGTIADSKLNTTLQLKDKKAKDRYVLSGALSQASRGLHFVFNPDSLLLNYQKWQMPKDNFVEYDSSGILVKNLTFSSQTQSLSINSVGETTNSPITAEFHNFKIKTITQFVEQDSLLLDGTINGKAEVKDVLTKPLFTADLKIDTLAYLKDTLGTLVLQVDNKELNAYTAHISLKGHENDVVVDGKYFSGESKMDMAVKLNQLNLASFKSMAASQVKDMHGFLRGDLHASGDLDQPVLRGELHFDSAVIVPYLTGEPLSLSGDAIYFDEDGFNFAEFAMKDSAGNTATVDGNVFTKDFKEYKFDLTFVANNFRVVNAPKDPNRMFYGKLNINADADVTGDSKLPKIEANLRVNKKTDFFVILPSDDPEVVERDGVVIFANKNANRDTVKLRNFLDSLATHARLSGMDLSVNIETDSSGQFTLIIDERNGDALALRGRADLNATVDKSGKVSLTGNYELENGSYNLTLSVLHRKFDIQRGSVITWTGDPRTANIDITAIYTVNTASIDLMQQQLAGRTGDDVNKYKQRLPFQVKLHMTGELLKPIIKFEITLPPNYIALWPDVDLKLTQMGTDEAEVNKQVFALLLLGRFVNENPFESSSPGTDAGLIARQSASKILSDQLNQLAGSLVTGVDISFDMNSQQDYSTGTAQNQTDLNVNVSKSLFNDRVRVTVGSDFQLEQVNPGQNTTNIAGDVNVDYKLSKDGRYMIRVYRKDQYQTEIQGQVVETGLSFILTFDYNKFRELFQNKKEPPPVTPKKKSHTPASTTTPAPTNTPPK